MTLKQYEDDIKRYLLPYDTNLKITKIGDYVDDEVMQPNIPIVKQLGWAALSSQCNYPI